MKSKRSSESRFVQIISVVIVIAVLVVVGVPLNFNDHTYTVTVTDKERINTKDSSKYLVFCEELKTDESLVFQNTDTLLRGKFNSSNIQGELKPNHEYEITVVGYRIPFISSYENIIDVKEKQ